MPENRFFSDSPLHPQEELRIGGQEFHHLAHVMRIKIGERIEVVNGKNCLAWAELISIKKNEALLRILDVEKRSPPVFKIILAQAIPRNNRLDTIVEKATELGMTSLWLFPGEMSEKKTLMPAQRERVRTLAIAAMKQCGRLDLPEIELLPALLHWQKQHLSHPAFFGDLSPGAPLLSKLLSETFPTQGMIFFIGPEGGFAEKEIDHLRSLDVVGVKLHNNILRTDTAALLTLSIASHELLVQNSN